MKRNLLIASTSTIYGSSYLDYLKDEIGALFKGIDVVVFIPYARPGGITYDGYTNLARQFFSGLGISVSGLHETNNPKEAIRNAKAIFTGGGNTFVLLNQLYRDDLIITLRKRLGQGVPYLGTSAGSNILGISIKTTNDMPIVFPPSFDALGMVPFNINPHYIDADPASQHMGETRDTRIMEFLEYNEELVVGLREGSYLRVIDDKIILGGDLMTRIFEKGKNPYEVTPNDDVGFLLKIDN